MKHRCGDHDSLCGPPRRAVQDGLECVRVTAGELGALRCSCGAGGEQDRSALLPHPFGSLTGMLHDQPLDTQCVHTGGVVRDNACGVGLVGERALDRGGEFGVVDHNVDTFAVDDLSQCRPGERRVQQQHVHPSTVGADECLDETSVIAAHDADGLGSSAGKPLQGNGKRIAAFVEFPPCQRAAFVDQSRSIRTTTCRSSERVRGRHIFASSCRCDPEVLVGSHGCNEPGTTKRGQKVARTLQALDRCHISRGLAAAADG
jgi:hypothetical protein